MANYLKEITITTSNTAKKTPSTKGKNAGTIKKGKRYKYFAVTKDPDDKTGIKKWFKIQSRIYDGKKNFTITFTIDL